MDHVCFTMQVDPVHLDRYERMHRDAWPELLVALGDADWRNYGLFLRDDGFLIGHLEAEDWPTARSAMDSAEVSPRWSAEMDQLVVPGTRMRWLPLVAASSGHPLDGPSPRGVAVGSAVASTADVDGRFALFAADDGTVIAYAEHPQDAAELAASLVISPDPRPFRRVFDLEHQLARWNES